MNSKDHKLLLTAHITTSVGWIGAVLAYLALVIAAMTGQSEQLIGPHDLWLAASCVANGLAMVTANVREFERVPGLHVEQWQPSA